MSGNGVKLELAKLTSGVPQGSILGPLLLFLHVSDMKAVVNYDLLLYADDLVLMVSGKDIANNESMLSNYNLVIGVGAR